MIAKKEWFKRRKYGGWGVSPRTWQGWVYIAFILIPFMIFQAIPAWSEKSRLIVTGVWIGFLFIDIIPVMVNLKRDEREFKIEAMAERNAAWFMSLVLAIGIFYEIVRSALNETISVNVFLVIALFGGAIVKTISNVIYERRKI
jgi:hypothetical protein